jgi:hypothetical protein
VIVPAAAPIKTPLIGPPQSFGEPYHYAGSPFPAPW